MSTCGASLLRRWKDEDLTLQPGLLGLVDYIWNSLRLCTIVLIVAGMSVNLYRNVDFELLRKIITEPSVLLLIGEMVIYLVVNISVLVLTTNALFTASQQGTGGAFTKYMLGYSNESDFSSGEDLGGSYSQTWLLQHIVVLWLELCMNEAVEALLIASPIVSDACIVHQPASRRAVLTMLLVLLFWHVLHRFFYTCPREENTILFGQEASSYDLLILPMLNTSATEVVYHRSLNAHEMLRDLDFGLATLFPSTLFGILVQPELVCFYPLRYTREQLLSIILRELHQRSHQRTRREGSNLASTLKLRTLKSRSCGVEE